jgi:glycosyltransferase involved in cell wall biosynthesis
LKNKIAYIITPNAISPQLFKRGKLKKLLYGGLVEKSRFQKASGLTAVTPREEKHIRQYIPKYKGHMRCIPNPIDLSELCQDSWQANTKSRKIVYLGRYDVLHKGIDILIKIASFLPENIEVHLYGTKDAKTQDWFNQLQKNLPRNVFIHGPVFGAMKVKILTEACLYIQTSRWEVFGISIAEAMYLGVPCAVTNTVNLSEIFQQHDLGCVLSSEPQQAAMQLSEVLDNPDQLHRWSQRSKLYAKEHFQAQIVAESFLNFYQEVI